MGVVLYLSGKFFKHSLFMFGVHMCHHARVELRGWLAGLSSFCLLFGPGDQAQVIRFGDTGHQRNFC